MIIKRLHLGIAALVVIILCLLCVIAFSDTINISKLADAIFKAENSKSHPYGIMTKYKTTTPRQACINTIKSALRRWDGKGDFIVFLGKTYCPPDAHPLNKNWVKNVTYFYERGEK